MKLEEAVEIAQNQDAHQFGYTRSEFKGDPVQMEVHKLRGNWQPGAKWNRQQPQRPLPVIGPVGQVIRNKGSQREKVVSTAEAQPSHPKSESPAKKAKCFKFGKEGHYGSVCRIEIKCALVSELQV